MEYPMSLRRAIHTPRSPWINLCFNDLETLRRIIFSQQVKTVQQDSVAHSSAIYRLLLQEHPIL
jgi:hypothetical protein